MAKKKKAAPKSKAKSKAKTLKAKTLRAKAGVKKAPKKAAQKKAAKKRPAKRSSAKAVTPSGLRVQLPPALEERVRALAATMNVPLEQLLVMALGEFTEAWEDHMQTIGDLNHGDDRMQIVVPSEEAKKEE